MFAGGNRRRSAVISGGKRNARPVVSPYVLIPNPETIKSRERPHKCKPYHKKTSASYCITNKWSSIMPGPGIIEDHLFDRPIETLATSYLSFYNLFSGVHSFIMLYLVCRYSFVIFTSIPEIGCGPKYPALPELHG